MSQPLQDEIVSRVTALLAVAPALAGGRIEDSGESRPLAEQDESRIWVNWDSSTCARMQFKGQPNDWTTRVRVEVQARTSAAASALAMQVNDRMAADPGLNGYTQDGTPIGLMREPQDGDATVCKVQVVWEYQRRSPSTSIAA
ncbi:MAG: hypothetical protein AB7P37_03265 [Ramlibacter sp.]